MALDRKVSGNRTITVKEVTAWAEEDCPQEEGQAMAQAARRQGDGIIVPDQPLAGR